MSADDPSGARDAAEYTAFHVARTPAEANLVRSLLEGAGIPAHVEGGMLADEYAVSQRLMNVQGVRVFVRRNHVERAREILAEARVPDSELEQQALAAADEEGAEQPPPPRAPAVEGGERPSSRLPAVLAGVFAVLTVLCFGLWMEGRSEVGSEDPLWTYEAEEDGWRGRWRHNGADAFRQLDRDRDGIYEETHWFDREGRPLTVAHDDNGDGLPERLVEHRDSGLRLEWIDDDGDGRYDLCRVQDADGRLLRELRYAGAEGFVEVERR